MAMAVRKLVLPVFAVSPSLPNRAALSVWSKRWPPLCCRCCSSSSSSSNQFSTSDVLQLAQKAHISLTPQEVEDFRPKLEQLVGWFAQLQEVDLAEVVPALRADNVSPRALREDVPLPFEDRDSMLAAVPETEGPYVRVPKILKENLE